MREKVRFTQAFKLFWTNYFNFKGRSRRSEYWFAMLWHLIFMIPTIIGYSFGIFCLILSEIFKRLWICRVGGSNFNLFCNLYFDL